ncbi:hypothetical protein FZ103_15825 [Streptomonospora sp. PA3]|uniref:hypothetical protein n=1 Tax=Streptomonospora sp. PA3 TaxID=2607326 RepID=UPI0012DD2398|nr:hypothetical protein [Streptomonospora sp. PA3]MUL42622.1 hypothetical protein [Streptomonospora sp. PA3]
MNRITRDAETGYVPEEELLQLTEPADDLVAGAAEVQSTTVVCGISAVTSAITAASAAMGDNCPTTACTTYC